MNDIVCGRCSVILIVQYWRCLFFININIFRHLMLEIALAIPASNDEKYNWINSAGQGLLWVAIAKHNFICFKHSLIANDRDLIC